VSISGPQRPAVDLVEASKEDRLGLGRGHDDQGDAVTEKVIGIVGLGAVGSILGAYLARSGVRVYGVDASKKRAKQVNRDGLIVRGADQLQEKPEKCFDTLGELSEVEDLRAVFLCVKTWAISQIMEEFVNFEWPEEMRIVALMNGIGPEDEVGRFVPKERVWRGIINYAGNLDPEGWANMAFWHPPNLVGPASERVVWWTGGAEELMTKAGL
jgi:ketopantoate reductase